MAESWFQHSESPQPRVGFSNQAVGILTTVPPMWTFPEATPLALSGANTPADDQNVITMSVHRLGEDNDGVPVVFCHGFPELAYSWRYQLPAVADAGFRAIAADQRGYGSTTAPADIHAYGLANLAGDLADMLDELGIDKAIFVGHDWGGYVAWAMPVLFPERTAGVVGICSPYQPFATTELLRALFPDPDKMYMLWFQEPGVAESFLDDRVAPVFENLMVAGRDPREMADDGIGRGEGMDFNPFRRIEELSGLGDQIASREELDHYIDTFNHTGFRGAINWYRNIDAESVAHPDIGTKVLDIPTLMITAQWDPALPPSMAEGMEAVCTDLETHMVERAGHWVQQEYPDQVNSYLTDWLTRRFASPEPTGS